MDLICGICMETLGSEKAVCCLPCGHVKHIACLRMWSVEEKNCPNCWQRFQPAAAIRKRLYFDRDPDSDNQTHGVKIEADQDDSVFAINEVLKHELEESKDEVNTTQTRVNDLEESILELERKYQTSEIQLEQTSERNRQLTAELHTLEDENRKCLERNRELEQDLSNSQDKMRDFETKFDQTDVGQLVAFIDKKSENLKNCEVSRLRDSLEAKNNQIARLQGLLNAKNDELENERKLCLSIAEQLGMKDAEAAKLSDEKTKAERDLCDILKRLTASEKRNDDTIKDNEKVKRELIESQTGLAAAEKRNIDSIKEMEKMEAQLAEWQRFHRKIARAAKFADGIGEENEEPTNSHSLQQQNPMPLDPVMNNCEVSRLQDSLNAKNDELENERKLCLSIAEQLGKKDAEAAKLSDERTKVKRNLCDLYKILTTSEKRNDDTIKDNEMVKQERLEPKENEEPTNSHSLQQQNPMPLVPVMNVWNRQNQNSGSDSAPAKRARIDTIKNPEEDNAMDAANMAFMQQSEHHS